jgi:hypothetical protein
VSVADRLATAPPADLARRALEGGSEAWIVGGAVRDAALGREVTDLDLAVAGDPAAAARAIARESGGHAFELSAEFGTWRVVASDRSRQIDATALRGETIEADLAARDFTVGAVAVPLAGGEPLDPYGGLTDLEGGLLRAVGEGSFSEDPLRLLRAARLASELELAIDPGTVVLARATGPAPRPPAPPSPPGSGSWPSCASSSAGPTRCAASSCSTSWGSPRSSCPSWRRCGASGRAPITTSMSTATRSRS